MNSACQMSQKRASVGANTLRVSPHSGEAAKLIGSRVRKRMMGEQHQAHPPTPDLYLIERHSVQKHTHVHTVDTNSLCQDGPKHKQTFTRSLPLTGQWDAEVPKARENCSVWVRQCVLGIALQLFRGKPGGYMCRMHRSRAVCLESKIDSHHVCIEKATLIISTDAQPF